MSAAPWDDAVADRPPLLPPFLATADEPTTATDTTPPREHPFPGNVLMHVDGMGTDSEGMPDPHDETRTVVENLDSAMVVTSLVAAQVPPSWGQTEPYHRPVLDIDLGVVAVPSTTPGRWHLMLDHRMPWSKYLDLLDALATAGLVQPGYVKAARAREHTAVRVPWLRKGDQAPELIDPACPRCRYGGHRCPKCDAPLSHGRETCSRDGLRCLTDPDPDADQALDSLRARLAGGAR